MRRRRDCNPHLIKNPNKACVLISFPYTDVSDIRFVINFDYPSCSEDYVHRIGRTARAEQSGTAYTFFTPDNSKQARDLIEVLREANQQINPKLQSLCDAARDYGKGLYP